MRDECSFDLAFELALTSWGVKPCTFLGKRHIKPVQVAYPELDIHPWGKEHLLICLPKTSPKIKEFINNFPSDGSPVSQIALGKLLGYLDPMIMDDHVQGKLWILKINNWIISTQRLIRTELAGDVAKPFQEAILQHLGLETTWKLK